MIEVRNDEVATPEGRKWWADCLARALLNIVPSFVQNAESPRGVPQ
jgi:predicted N-formylglutamate amidohydrolase